MTKSVSIPPFRADHVGSFLRPERLREAREKFAAGELAAIVAELVGDEDEQAIALREGARWVGRLVHQRPEAVRPEHMDYAI